MKPVRTAARAMLSSIFVISGARALANPDPMVLRAKKVTDRVGPLLERTDPRLPTDARSLVRLNGAVNLVGGLLLATGRFGRPAAAVLAGSLVPTTLAGHPFWSADPIERPSQRIHFLKNVGLLGGLLFAAADTQGKPSLRYRTGHFIGRQQRTVRRTMRTVRREAKIAAASAALARRLPR